MMLPPRRAPSLRFLLEATPFSKPHRPAPRGHIARPPRSHTARAMWITSNPARRARDPDRMARYPAPLPPALPWPVFSHAEAMTAGLSRDRLNRSDLQRLRRGLYARRDVNFKELDLAAALCRDDPELVVVGLSAARLHGIPMPWRLESWDPKTSIHLATLAARGRPHKILTWHDYALAPGEVTTLVYRVRPSGHTSAIRATTRARTWRDLAPHLTHQELVAAGDHLIRRPYPWAEDRTNPWCTPAQLSAACTGRHALALRRALADVRVGADSPMETRLRLAFAAAGLPEPQLNTVLVGPAGVEHHCPDFQWPAYGLCVEYEGDMHNDDEQVARDIRRARAVKSAGSVEVRLHKADIGNDCASAVRIVREALVERGWRPAA